MAPQASTVSQLRRVGVSFSGDSPKRPVIPRLPLKAAKKGHPKQGHPKCWARIGLDALFVDFTSSSPCRFFLQCSFSTLLIPYGWIHQAQSLLLRIDAWPGISLAFCWGGGGKRTSCNVLRGFSNLVVGLDVENKLFPQTRIQSDFEGFSFDCLWYSLNSGAVSLTIGVVLFLVLGTPLSPLSRECSLRMSRMGPAFG